MAGVGRRAFALATANSESLSSVLILILDVLHLESPDSLHTVFRPKPLPSLPLRRTHLSQRLPLASFLSELALPSAASFEQRAWFSALPRVPPVTLLRILSSPTLQRFLSASRSLSSALSNLVERVLESRRLGTETSEQAPLLGEVSGAGPRLESELHEGTGTGCGEERVFGRREEIIGWRRREEICRGRGGRRRLGDGTSLGSRRRRRKTFVDPKWTSSCCPRDLLWIWIVDLLRPSNRSKLPSRRSSFVESTRLSSPPFLGPITLLLQPQRIVVESQPSSLWIPDRGGGTIGRRRGRATWISECRFFVVDLARSIKKRETFGSHDSLDFLGSSHEGGVDCESRRWRERKGRGSRRRRVPTDERRKSRLERKWKLRSFELVVRIEDSGRVEDSSGS